MQRLIRAGLMFGNLFHVSSPALVERYNRALKHLTGKTTKLTDFHVDISGYSPEVGDELDDHLYLNHAGVNRQFILLSMDQRRCPLLNTKFSTSRGILQQFYAENEAQLFALTARDAVAGELVNSVYDVSTPARLFDIRRITIDADTTGGTVRDAKKLGRLVGRFKNDQDGWFDDVLIAEMIDLAGKTGDVVRNPVKLSNMAFDQRDFWTAHFGGMYIFQDVEHPAVIAPSGKEGLGELPLKYVFDARDRNRIAQFFELNGLTETIIEARGINSAAILRQKMDFILVDAVANSQADLAGATRGDMRRLARQHSDKLPPEFHALAALVNWAENGGPWPRIASDHPAYFYTLRAADTKDAALVNMLLAELAAKDIRQLFICHKELFYRTYAGWSEAKKAYVVAFLEAEYQADKAGARAALFGHDAPMEEPKPAKPDPVSDRIAAVGPWGAVRRR
ncbi:DUF6638 family protein [Sulfitobacter aestuariivivens]|uniref:Uncharacterized protein n=1 Tax=Sulfitobacter aestuariivivens TaxID=2766981 RepID=A0A927D8T1_9RHOB|nr:DUF6638 family protein [Sulfitobacter aestuariivivens]MBD3664861.1 hypothetical protein [Sulfitobacter aestuariivivens]